MKSLIVAACSLASLSMATIAAPSTEPTAHQLTLQVRSVHFDRDFETDALDLRQSALGIQLNASSAAWKNIVSVGASAYQIQKLSASGLRRSDLFHVDNHGDYETSSSQLGQAYLNLHFGQSLSARLGRQTLDTLFLDSSGSRAVPSSFQGVSVSAKVAEVALYGVWVDRWSPRHDDSFVPFFTDRVVTGQAGNAAIDYISIIGAEYQHGDFSARLEQVSSHDYLTKQALMLRYHFGPQLSRWTLAGGYLNSRDDGELFVDGAERGEVDAGTDSNHSNVYFATLDWAAEQLSLGMAMTLVRDDVWIEDLYSGDHGTTPLPTRAPSGQDLTGKNANVWQVRASYDWSQVVTGLSTLLLYTHANGAENTYDKALGSADEWYTAMDVTWAVPAVKGLRFRWLCVDYHSDENGRVAEVKEDTLENRLYLDFAYQF